MTKNNYYCVILAGGRGMRLWPQSRQAAPKQFVDFFGVGRSLLQQTFDRFVKIMPKEHIFVSANSCPNYRPKTFFQSLFIVIRRPVWRGRRIAYCILTQRPALW